MAGTSTVLDLPIADSVRAARTRCGFTLDQLAERTGLSKAYLSRLESGERQPSIATLLVLSRALEAPISQLLGERRTGAPIAFFGDDQPGREVNGLTVSTQSGFAGSEALEALRIVLSPDRTPPAMARHRGEEWLYVLTGRLRLEYGNELHLLEPGTSAHFDAEVPHRLGSDGSRVELLLVAAETPNDLLRAHRYGDHS
jgi:transcriptional regulator with XRE-family HTH domain